MPQDLIGSAWLFSRTNDPPSAERRIFAVLWSYMVGKYALICAIEIQKIQMVVHIFSGFALFTELMLVYRGFESLCKLLTTNKVPLDDLRFTNK